MQIRKAAMPKRGCFCYLRPLASTIGGRTLSFGNQLGDEEMAGVTCHIRAIMFERFEVIDLPSFKKPGELIRRPVGSEWCLERRIGIAVKR